MGENEIIIITYILVLNLFGFLIMGFDKFAAIRDFRRIPEKTLFAIGLLGGAIGVYLGMTTFRHKTKTQSFTYGIPILIALNIVILALFFTN